MSALSHPGSRTRADFNVLIVYDDFVSGQQAVQTYERFMLQHGDRANVRLKTYTFDLLKNREFNKTAVKDAARAEIIILAAACEELPAPVVKWLDAWRVRPDKHRGSFIAVLSHGANCDKQFSLIENELKTVSSIVDNFLIETTRQTSTWSSLSEAFP